MQTITKRRIVIVIAVISLIPISILILIFSSVLLFLFPWPLISLKLLFMFGGIQPNTTIHKAMNHNKYNLVVVSKVNYASRLPHGYIYLEVWSDNKKTKSYRLSHTDEISEYDYRIKDVTLLPDNNEIRVEFDGNYGIGPDGKSYVDVGLYKIVDD